MPDVMDLYPHIREWDTARLHARRNEFEEKAARDGGLPDEDLQEMVCILRVLRTRASSNQAKGRTPSTRSAPTLDML